MRATTYGLVMAMVACASEERGGSVAIETVLLGQRSLLANVTTLRVSAYETTGNLDCDLTRGQLVGTAPAAIAEAALGTTCSDGAKFCGRLSVPRSTDDRIFAVVASSADNPTYAIGCARAKVDAAEVSVGIRLFRRVGEPTCGNGEVEPTEQCDSADVDAQCDDSCHTQEVLLTKSPQGVPTGRAGEKVEPFALVSTPSSSSARVLVFYGDRSPGANATDIGVVGLTGSLEPLATPALFANGPTFLPNEPGVARPAAAPFSQWAPAAAAIGSRTFVAFEDADSAGSNGVDIHLRSFDASFAPLQGSRAALGINGPSGNGEPSAQSSPAIAASGSELLLAWLDNGSGMVRSRTFTPSATATSGSLGNVSDIGSGRPNGKVELVGLPNGWVCVWTTPEGISRRAFDAAGRPDGEEQVSAEPDATSPAIAALPDGRFAIAFAAPGPFGLDVFIQRFTPAGVAVPGDLDRPINERTVGDQTDVAIAAGRGTGGDRFAVVWLDSDTQEVRGRLFDGSSGFAFNPVDGQLGEFTASRETDRTRAHPAAAMPGDGLLVVLWEDTASTGPFGIVGRRFVVE